jgi:AcrR family transcriptional regulator
VRAKLQEIRCGNDMAKPPPKSHRQTARQPTRRPGHIRFRQLLGALEALLEENSLQKVGLYQIAERAEVPAASVYHFFPNKEAALLALAAEYHTALHDLASEPLNPPPASWQDLVRRKVTLAADYHNDHPAALRLFMGAGVTVEVKTADTGQTVRLAQRRAQVLDAYFHVPHVPDWERRLATSIAIVDGVFGLSYAQHGIITPDFVDDAWRASIAYLRTFLPEQLEGRPNPPAPAQDGLRAGWGDTAGRKEFIDSR